MSLVGLIVGLLLNAPGIQKSAHIQPEGWKRDVALGVAGPLETVSHALLLDRPRQGLKAVLGRSDDDEIDTAVAVPEPPPSEPAASSPPPPPERQKFSPARPLRLWIAGDSLVVVPGESLLRAAAANRAIERTGEVDGRIASGLERPDVFNWFTHVRKVMEEERPRAVVVMFGGNDDHGFMTGLPEGIQISSFGSSSWSREYRRRVSGLMDTVTRRDGYLVWIGLPISSDAEQTRRYDAINAIVSSEAAERPGRVAYLDTYFFFAGERRRLRAVRHGQLGQAREDARGRRRALRAPCGRPHRREGARPPRGALRPHELADEPSPASDRSSCGPECRARDSVEHVVVPGPRDDEGDERRVRPRGGLPDRRRGTVRNRPGGHDRKRHVEARHRGHRVVEADEQPGARGRRR